MKIAYLDTSAIFKRYVLEPGSDVINDLYAKALTGELRLVFSVWNIGEVLGVLDKYRRREWLSKQNYVRAKHFFVSETLRLLKLKVIRAIPVKNRLLTESWRILDKYHIYEADALQIVTAKHVNASELYTGDKRVYEAATSEGINTTYLD